MTTPSTSPDSVDGAVTGRLAPSPTGRLHLGNLSSSLLAWIQARRSGGRVVLRVEDVDQPRTRPGAEEAIVDDLRWLGIDWDEGPDIGGAGGPYRQSERTRHYEDALDVLIGRDLVYPCFCSRKDIREALSAPHEPTDASAVYPGTCAGLDPQQAWERARAGGAALRFRARGNITFSDGIWGDVNHELEHDTGDFVLRRREQLFAYHLAVVVDDMMMGITDVVRGRDLLDATAAQIALHRALGSAPPRTWHVPLLHDARGERFSKRSSSTARDGISAAGWTPGLLRGALARMWGWLDEVAPLELDELLSLWDPAPLRRARIDVPDAFFAGPNAYR